jgi:quinolinate synthase
MLWQSPLPPTYTDRSEADLAAAIAARKRELGSDLVILGHHYQQDAVIQFADFTGDSFKLSQLAAERVRQAGAKYVVFCGVHFMAETADILANAGGDGGAVRGEDVQVILPDLSAGCSMADMADHDDTVEAYQIITQTLAEQNIRARVIPICYMNSTAAIKAFCGEHGGAVCTSSNCDKVFAWALRGGDTPLATDGGGESVKILFMPDQHLGRNTAAAMGYDVTTATCVWDPKSIDGMGGIDEQTIADSTFILWKGHCSVHKLFRPEHVDQIRAAWPDVTVMVHPECVYEVCQKADLTGSTEGIIATIEKAAPGTRWAIGTEVHLVNRLAKQAAGRGVEVRILSDCQCLCTTMFRIDMPHLLWTLDNLAPSGGGEVVNRITVAPEVKRQAQIALDRMLRITAQASSTRATPVAVD